MGCCGLQNYCSSGLSVVDCGITVVRSCPEKLYVTRSHSPLTFSQWRMASLDKLFLLHYLNSCANKHFEGLWEDLATSVPALPYKRTATDLPSPTLAQHL